MPNQERGRGPTGDPEIDQPQSLPPNRKRSLCKIDRSFFTTRERRCASVNQQDSNVLYGVFDG